MKFLTTLLFAAAIISCSTREQTSRSDFQIYLQSLERLETPLTFRTLGSFKTMSKNYDKALFKRFGRTNATYPHGKIFDNDSIAVLIDIIIGDVAVPLLTTYNQDGDKIDSLNFYQTAGGDVGYESTEFVTINSKREIILIDSVSTWDLNDDQNDVIPGTRKLQIDSIVFRIDSDGKILKISN